MLFVDDDDESLRNEMVHSGQRMICSMQFRFDSDFGCHYSHIQLSPHVEDGSAMSGHDLSASVADLQARHLLYAVLLYATYSQSERTGAMSTRRVSLRACRIFVPRTKS